MKTKERTRRKTKRPVNRPSQSQVVYTQPQAVNRRKLLWRLGGVAAIVLALMLGLPYSSRWVLLPGPRLTAPLCRALRCMSPEMKSIPRNRW